MRFFSWLFTKKKKKPLSKWQRRENELRQTGKPMSSEGRKEEQEFRDSKRNDEGVLPTSPFDWLPIVPDPAPETEFGGGDFGGGGASGNWDNDIPEPDSGSDSGGDSGGGDD